MSRFEDSYLAESVGYATGHANGLKVGRAQGYTNGWNDAVSQTDQEFEKKNQTIRMLDERCINIHSSLMARIENLEKCVASLEQAASLQQEQAQSLRAEYEGMQMAFLGAVAIAFPAMKAVAKLSLKERSDVLYEYGQYSIKLQSKEYVSENRFPHNQTFIKKYLPIANQVFSQTHEQMQEAEIKAEPAN